MTETVKSNKVEFKVTFRNVEHFYKVVTWLNKNVGRGKDNWTIPGRVKRSLERNRKPVIKNIHVFKEGFDAQETAMYLNLL